MANLDSKLSTVHVPRGRNYGCSKGPNPALTLTLHWGLGTGAVCSAGSWELWWEVLNTVLTCVRNHSVKSKCTGEMTSEC